MLVVYFLCLLVFVVIFVQSSSLLVSSALVGLSLLLSFLVLSTSVLETVWIPVLYVLIFVGGYLVLLVSVSSFSNRDQNRPTRYDAVASAFYMFGMSVQPLYFTEPSSKSVSINSSTKKSFFKIVLSVLVLLLVAFLVLTLVLLVFKGLVRLT